MRFSGRPPPDGVICRDALVDDELAEAIAAGYEECTISGDRSVLGLFAADVLDNVSGRRGFEIFDIIERWLNESFADRTVEHHATMFGDAERVVVWYTAYGRHVGNGFPRMAGMPVTDVVVAWPQLQVFLTKRGLVVEHWAVRDDFAMLEQLRQAAG